MVAEDFPNPKGAKGRARAAEKIETVFSEAAPDPGTLSPEAASEILLVARWFRLREKEMSRVLTPEEWLSAHAPSS
jgi:hypothetical protein